MAVVKINAIEVAEGQGPELERRFAGRKGTVDQAPGFLSFQLLRPVSGDGRYFVMTHWESDEAYRSWMADAMTGHGGGGGGRPVGTGSSVLEFEVVDLEAVAAAES